MLNPISRPLPLPDTSAFELLDVPVAWVDGQGWLLGANTAFGAATGHGAAAAGQPLARLLGLHAHDATTTLLARGERFSPRPVLGRTAAGDPLRALLSLRPWGGLNVVTLQPAAAVASAPAPEADAPPDREQLADLLALAQSLCRLTVWAFDADAPASADALPFDQAAWRVPADDRPALQRAFARSLQQPGVHEQAYRLQDADGQVRHLRSMWQVRAGPAGASPRALGLVVDDGDVHRLARTADDIQTQLHLAVTLADIGIWRHDSASGCVQLNEQGWALLGLTPRPAGLPMAALLALLHPDDQAAVRRQARADRTRSAGAEADAPVDLGARWRHADGRWHYLLTRRVTQRDAAGRRVGHLGVAINLSGRFENQQRATALAQRLEMATAAAGVGVWSALLGEPPVAHWDDQMRALHGLPVDAPAPMWSDYIARHVHPADRQATAEAMATLLQRREGLLDMDLRIVRPDGSVRRLATRSSVGGPDGARYLHGVMLDMTERRATEDRLREAHERAALAARGAGIGTWESSADTLTGLWDEQMFRLRGREPTTGPVTQEMMMAWVHPADRDAQLRRMTIGVRDDVPIHSEFRVVLPDGSVRWLASRATPVRDEQGRTVRRIGINWDITDARNAAAEREERQLAQRENQAKSRLLARISHELRTPLNAVLGFTQLMLTDSQPDPAAWRRQVAHVQASGEHLLAMIDDVLELSSLESGELPMSLQPVALRPLVETSLPLVEMLARQHGVTLHLGELAGWALADPVRLRQVLLNLLSNAIKYNRRGGRATVSALAQDGWLLLRVEDTGQGMSEEHLGHLFEPFNRLGREGDDIAGTGIGLAIVRAAVQQMGGGVQVRSTLGQGSCFELSLQQAEPPKPPQRLAAPEVTRAPPLPAGGLVVYIEDNELNLLIIEQMMLRRPDLRFASAPDGRQGLALVRARQPALLLLDMQLPDMDGHEVLRQLRADPATAGICCIAVSANAMPEDIRRAREAGFADYWTKPLDLRAFLASLDALFGPAPT